MNNPFNTMNNNTSFTPAFQDSGHNGDVLLADLLTPEPIGGAPQPTQQQQQSLTDADTKDLSSVLAKAARSLGMTFCQSSLQPPFS